MPLRAAQIPDYTDFKAVTPADLQAEPLRVAYAYWRVIRGMRRFPARADIHPRDIASVLRNVSLIKYEDGDFLYRIVGDSIVRAFDLTLHNRKLSELTYDEPGFGFIVRPLLERCVETGDVIAIRGHTGRDLVRVNFTDYENVLLPLGPDDSHVDHVMVVSHYDSHPYL